MIISLSGLIGSGKDTVADFLVEQHGFHRGSFAGSLKDAVAVVFDWDRELLEGKTKEARAWREEIDTWWAERLNMPHLSPRWVLQYWGTEVCRQNFHGDIWIASLENKLRQGNENVVISDCRFPNEINMVQQLGGTTVKVQRAENPAWWETAVTTNAAISGVSDQLKELFNVGEHITQLHPEVHISEWAWAGADFDITLLNTGTLLDLEISTAKILEVERYKAA